MVEYLPLKNTDDYFKKQIQREKKGVFFNRFIGYDDEILIFLKRYIVEIQKHNGIYIKKAISNPTNSEIEFFQNTVKSEFNFESSLILNDVKLWFNDITRDKQQYFFNALMEMLTELKNTGSNLNILKNSYIKFMCWGKYIFQGVLGNLYNDNVPKILYEGDITKYELYMLRILSMAGCDIVYVNFFDDNSYKKIDSSSKYSGLIKSKKLGNPPVHFTNIDLSGIEKAEKLKKDIENVNNIISTNDWLSNDFFEAILLKNAQRGNLNNINNLFIQYLGIDNEDNYYNKIFNLKKKIEQNGKICIIEKMIVNPYPDEINKVNRISYINKENMIEKLAIQIQISNDNMINSLIQNAFIKCMKISGISNESKLYNLGIRYICLLNRYSNKLFFNLDKSNIPVFIYWGNPNNSESMFLVLLSMLPVDVLVINSDKTVENNLINTKGIDKLKIINLDNSCILKDFPTQERKIRVATTAYQASKELDTLLYTDTGMYRDRQFTRSTPVTLKTTYDEIAIYWEQDANFRPAFEIKDNRVFVPNIFAKVNGVEGSLSDYKKTICRLVTENNTITCLKKQGSSQIFRPTTTTHFNCNGLIINGKLRFDRVKNLPNYPYRYLNENIQDYILEKIDELINLKWIKDAYHSIELEIIDTILSLTTDELRLIQQFDFTKSIPKLLIVDLDNHLFNLRDCIHIAFLNLIGFDIVIFTPTGYRNIEEHIIDDIYENYNIGNYMFDIRLNASDLKPIKSQKQDSIFNRFSRKFFR